MRRSPTLTWLTICGVLVFCGIRLHNLDAIPLFIDEAIAIERSERIANGTYLQHARTGKFLLPYFLLPFQPQVNAVWVTRTSVLLLCSLGFASVVAIACRYGGWKAALLAALLLAFSPTLFFFDRFALADSMLHAVLSLWVWSLLQALDRPRPHAALALLSGLMYVVALLAKASALFLLPLPIVIAWLRQRWGLHDRLKTLALFYSTVAAIWLPFAFFLAARQLDYFAKSDQVLATAGALFDLDRIAGNLWSLLAVVGAYDGWIWLLALLIVSAVGLMLRPRPLVLLLAGAIGYVFALSWLGGPALFSRYLVPALPLFFAAAAMAVAVVCDFTERRFKRDPFPLCVGATVLWIATISLPFMQQMYREPVAARLSRNDWHEYIGRNSAGSGIPDLADYLSAMARDSGTVVEGAFVGCYTLKLYLGLEPGLALQCPNVLAGERRANFLNVHLPREAEKHDWYYLVLESDGLVKRDELTAVRLSLLAEFPRPGGVSIIRLYAVNA